MNLTFAQFMNEVGDLEVSMRWRKGQALFNHLVTVAPKMANDIRATPLDPFFRDEKSQVYKECIKWLRENWGNDAFR